MSHGMPLRSRPTSPPSKRCSALPVAMPAHTHTPRHATELMLGRLLQVCPHRRCPQQNGHEDWRRQAGLDWQTHARQNARQLGIDIDLAARAPLALRMPSGLGQSKRGSVGEKANCPQSDCASQVAIAVGVLCTCTVPTCDEQRWLNLLRAQWCIPGVGPRCRAQLS